MTIYTFKTIAAGIVPLPSPELLEGIPKDAWPLLLHGASITRLEVFYTLWKLEKTRKKHFRGRKTLSPKSYLRYLNDVHHDWRFFRVFYVDRIDSWPPDLFDAAFPGVREERDRKVARRNARWGEVAL